MKNFPAGSTRATKLSTAPAEFHILYCPTNNLLYNDMCEQ